MKKIISIIAVAVLAVSMLTMVSCGKHEFSGSIDGDKNMTINAVNADAGDYFVTGTLVVEEGEEIAIDTASTVIVIIEMIFFMVFTSPKRYFAYYIPI